MIGLKHAGRILAGWGIATLAGATPLLAAQQGAGRRAPSYAEFLFQPKFIVMVVIGLIALALLKSRKMNSGLKITLLLVSTFLFGVAGNIPGAFFSSFAMHPSPICAAAKPFLFGFRIPFLVTLSVIFFLTLIGPKLFCGWVCPVGAVQELIAMGADRLKIKRIRPGFRVSQRIRLGIFLIFLFFSVTAVLNLTIEGRVFPLNIYDYINAFHGFEFQTQPSPADNLFHFLPFILSVILAFKFYRPFCHFICPVGLYTFFMEQIAFFRVRLKNHSACSDCGACEKAAPCAALPEILKGANLSPDCFACNVCLDSCPKKALDI